jgi:hypothetical protein
MRQILSEAEASTDPMQTEAEGGEKTDQMGPPRDLHPRDLHRMAGPGRQSGNFEASFMQSFVQTAACGRAGVVVRDIGGGHNLVNRPAPVKSPLKPAEHGSNAAATSLTPTSKSGSISVIANCGRLRDCPAASAARRSPHLRKGPP